ncbi:MAG TPA: hypothetical protein VHM26_14910, partial [Chitinophagaceae bacterium]|nr:hypothetical protein [Chitinophagaceae bacterium]
MRIIAAMLCLGIGIVAMAQPSSEIQIGNAINKVQWMQQSNTGTLVLATNSALIGLQPAQQKVVWEIKELGSAKEEDYSNIEGTPYFLVTTRATLGLGKPQTSIIEAETGRIIFNSKEAEMKVERAVPMPELQGLLIQGVRSKKKFVGLIDISSGVEKWTVDIGEAKGGLGGLVRKIKKSANALFAVE